VGAHESSARDLSNEPLFIKKYLKCWESYMGDIPIPMRAGAGHGISGLWGSGGRRNVIVWADVVWCREFWVKVSSRSVDFEIPGFCMFLNGKASLAGSNLWATCR
jgi:hypothetical protein